MHTLHHIIADKFHSLYMSDVKTAEKVRTLQSKNMRSIICYDTPMTKFPEYARYYPVFVTEKNSDRQLKNICELIQNNLKLSSVLVVCNNGLTGAPFIVIAYLISKGWQYEKAFYHVKQRNNLINPSVQAKKQLISFSDTVVIVNEEYSNFTSVLKQMWEKQDYFEESPCFNPLTDSFQDDGTKTPGFVSPCLKMRNSMRKNTSRKNSMLRSTSCHQRSETQLNYSFHLDEIVECQQEIKDLQSPQFLQIVEIDSDDDEIVRLRHRRHRKIRNKSQNI